MAWDISEKCTICGEEHTFYWEGENFPDNQKILTFICPNANKQVKVRQGIWVWKSTSSDAGKVHIYEFKGLLNA